MTREELAWLNNDQIFAVFWRFRCSTKVVNLQLNSRAFPMRRSYVGPGYRTAIGWKTKSEHEQFQNSNLLSTGLLDSHRARGRFKDYHPTIPPETPLDRSTEMLPRSGNFALPLSKDWRPANINSDNKRTWRKVCWTFAEAGRWPWENFLWNFDTAKKMELCPDLTLAPAQGERSPIIFYPFLRYKRFVHTISIANPL